MSSLNSPCIGVCSTGIGDTVCRGCKRYSHEIICWNGYADDEKRAILGRLDMLLSQVVRAKIFIFDEKQLKQQLDAQKVRYNPAAQSYCWVFDLLKAGANQIKSLEEFGCEVLQEFQILTFPALRDVIDEDFYVLSTVHFQRYFEMDEPSE